MLCTVSPSTARGNSVLFRDQTYEQVVTNDLEIKSFDQENELNEIGTLINWNHRCSLI